MGCGVVSIPRVAAELATPWVPRDLAHANESALRLVRLDGEFRWHQHDEDEAFLCWEGRFRIELSGGEQVMLQPGELFVVSRGVQHRPVAESPAYALLIERRETKQYGS